VPPDWPADLIAEQLRVDAARVASRPIVGSVLGRRHGFELAAEDDIGIAAADCGGFAVTIRGAGEPPPRLDLETAS
jgi:hypothetical protein